MSKQYAGQPFYLIAIAFSAGGLTPLMSILRNINLANGACVILRHVPVYHNNSLAALVGVHSGLPVRVIGEAMEIEAGCVYIAPSNQYAVVLNRRFYLLRRNPAELLNKSISVFLRSLLNEQVKNVVTVFLSGMGTDGVDCLGAVKHNGGKVIVQDPATCEYPSLTEKAIASGFADHILPPEGIGPLLNDLAVYNSVR